MLYVYADGDVHLGQLFPSVSKLVKLKHLNVITGPFSNNRNFAVELRNCTLLTRFEFWTGDPNQNLNLTNVHRHLPNLQHLVSNLSLATDTTGVSWRNLRTVRFTYSRNVTEACLINLLSFGRQLTQLQISLHGFLDLTEHLSVLKTNGQQLFPNRANPPLIQMKNMLGSGRHPPVCFQFSAFQQEIEDEQLVREWFQPGNQIGDHRDAKLFITLNPI